MKLFRLEFDDDSFLGSDDGFSAGWSVQVHSPMRGRWAPGLAGWIGRFPGLHDDTAGGRVVRWSWGVTQLIVTPHDVTSAAPQAGDAPWAGLFGGYVSWAAYDNRRLAALQAYVGCVGPCSQADVAQKLVHNDLHLGDAPRGWPNQLDDHILLNLNYEYRRKLWSGRAPDESRRGRKDISVGAQAGIGSFATYAEAWIEYRFGWDLPAGFTELADPPAFGIALDPLYPDEDGPGAPERSWRPYFTIVARLRAIARFAGTESGPTQNGRFYVKVGPAPRDRQVIVGVHFAKLPLAFHLSYYRYFDDAVIGSSRLDWVNVSFERRF